MPDLSNILDQVDEVMKKEKNCKVKRLVEKRR